MGAPNKNSHVASSDEKPARKNKRNQATRCRTKALCKQTFNTPSERNPTTKSQFYHNPVCATNLFLSQILLYDSGAIHIQKTIKAHSALHNRVTTVKKT